MQQIKAVLKNGGITKSERDEIRSRSMIKFFRNNSKSIIMIAIGILLMAIIQLLSYSVGMGIQNTWASVLIMLATAIFIIPGIIIWIKKHKKANPDMWSFVFYLVILLEVGFIIGSIALAVSLCMM